VSGGLSAGTVHVWATDVNAPTAANTFVQQASITPSNGSYSLTVQPGYIYTLTTTSGQAQGTAAGPAQSTLTLPYSDNFDRPARLLPVEAKALVAAIEGDYLNVVGLPVSTLLELSPGLLGA